MMTRAFMLALSLALVFSSLSGCAVAAVIGAAAYASGKADEDRKAFHEHNLEREKAGLPPLTNEQWLEKQTVEGEKPESTKN